MARNRETSGRGGVGGLLMVGIIAAAAFVIPKILGGKQIAFIKDTIAISLRGGGGLNRVSASGLVINGPGTMHLITNQYRPHGATPIDTDMQEAAIPLLEGAVPFEARSKIFTTQNDDILSGFIDVVDTRGKKGQTIKFSFTIIGVPPPATGPSLHAVDTPAFG